MIKFFRQSYAIQYVVIALLAISLWLPAFLSGKGLVGLESPVTPLYNLVNRLFAFSYHAQLVLSFVLILSNALMFNSILTNNQIVGKVGTMGAFVLVLLLSLTQTQTNFYPFLLSLFFVLLVIKTLYDTYMSQNPEIELLRVGIYIAIASFCYFQTILLIVWVMVSLPIAKKGSFRLELIPLTGLLFSYFLYFTGVYLFGDILPVMYGYRDCFLELTLSVSSFNIKTIILLAFLILVSVGLLFVTSNLEKSVAVRTKITMAVILLMLSVVMLFLGGNVLLNGLVFIALSVLFSYEFSYMDNTGWADLALALFLLFVFVNHYYLKLL